MEYIVGVAIALAVAGFGRVVGFDRDRSFYPLMLVVVASYYGLFAVVGGSRDALAAETLVFSLFVVMAVIGFKANLWIVAGALIGHGTLDFFHGDVIANPGVPAWWPMFCLTFDLTAGGYLAYVLLRADKKGVQARDAGGEDSRSRNHNSVERSSFRNRIRPYVEAELRAAVVAEMAGDALAGFGHLERAHVLGQASTIEHVRVHVRMFAWGVRQRRAREVVSQALRIVGAATMTAFKAIPQGNTGGSNVSAFRSMPIPNDLANIIAKASVPTFTPALTRALVLIALVFACGTSMAANDVRRAFVGERHITYRILGTGQPVIVMMSGLGDGMESFRDVAPDLAKDATVIVYDRAGYGGSAVGDRLSDAAAAAADLSALLAQTGINGPYVLLGHSLGGLFAEYFAATHPDQVSGLILEEARPADFGRRCEIARAGPCVPPSWMAWFMNPGAQSELAALTSTIEEVEAVKPLSSRNVLILTRPVAGSSKPIDRIWADAQNGLAAKYGSALRLTAPSGGHYIHHDNAPWFVETLRNFVKQIRPSAREADAFPEGRRC